MTEYAKRQEISLTVNGEVRRAVVAPADTLLHTLRDTLGLTGTKSSCENGDCGACTVHIDGVPIKSCLTLTLMVADREITTIEGLRDSPVQEGFREEYGFQCGFCTSGFIMNAQALLENNPGADAATRIDWLQSNICRCTGYEGIEKAIDHARRVGFQNGVDSQ